MGFAVTGGTWTVGWAFDVPWFVGLLIGLVVWVVALNAFVSLGRRRHNQQMAALTGGRGILRVPTAEKFNELRQEAQEMKADLQRSEHQRKRLAAERDALAKEASRETAQRTGQITDEELKRRCSEIADEMFHFLENRATDEAEKMGIQGVPDLMLEASRHEDETMRQYSQRFGSEAVALLEELEQRGWWKPGPYPRERTRLLEPANLLDVRRVAERLSAAGHRR